MEKTQKNSFRSRCVYGPFNSYYVSLSNPKLSIYGIDIDRKFALPSINYLKKKFPRSNKLLEGDSIEIIKNLKKKFDLFHIDGDHKTAKIYNEIIACTKLAKNKHMKILFDDADMMKSIDRSLVKSFKKKIYKT